MWIAQRGRCAICERGWIVTAPRACSRTSTTITRVARGNTRGCGRCIRALLCQACNFGIGYFRDDPELMERQQHTFATTPPHRSKPSSDDSYLRATSEQPPYVGRIPWIDAETRGIRGERPEGVCADVPVNCIVGLSDCYHTRRVGTDRFRSSHGLP